ncbi:hypothetical protein DRH29_00465 [candidate division Kazan bacterium]|uniref:Major facilitator superfamily (MFS) profile domain-containing protein n=1 Tax=candidate division Kazan bacterium TaxID=2202143 RepID=A0A420ZDY4_UNCK3|nr:MAG: hypothetical protein DRH29_00465 [candidate division Kazan bacterium]
MPVKGYLIGTSIATLLTLVAFLLVLFYFDPTTAGLVGVILFFISLGATLMGLITLLLYLFVRRKFLENPIKAYTISLRGGILLGAILISAGILKSLGALNWWNTAMIILVALVLEIYFRVK